jgi:hypothetical protein
LNVLNARNSCANWVRIVGFTRDVWMLVPLCGDVSARRWAPPYRPGPLVLTLQCLSEPASALLVNLASGT